MSITVCLLLYALVVTVLGPLVLTRLTAAGVAPQLGVTAWAAAIGGVVASAAAAAVLLAVEIARAWNQPARWVLDCFTGIADAVGGAAGSVLHIALIALSLLAMAAFVAAVMRTLRAVRRTRARTHRHAREARLIGRPHTEFDAVVLDSPEPAAYCVAGRGRTPW